MPITTPSSPNIFQCQMPDTENYCHLEFQSSEFFFSKPTHFENFSCQNLTQQFSMKIYISNFSSKKWKSDFCRVRTDPGGCRFSMSRELFSHCSLHSFLLCSQHGGHMWVVHHLTPGPGTSDFPSQSSVLFTFFFPTRIHQVEFERISKFSTHA